MEGPPTSGRHRGAGTLGRLPGFVCMSPLTLALACGALSFSAAALAAEPIPADPTGTPNQMVTDCMKQQDPALNKEDAIQLCRDKLKQGIKVDKPRKPEKPRDEPQESPQK